MNTVTYFVCCTQVRCRWSVVRHEKAQALRRADGHEQTAGHRVVIGYSVGRRGRVQPLLSYNIRHREVRA
jgi:hypothetical protein